MTPLPLPATVLVKAAGSPPLQIVCAAAMVPAVGTVCTVTVNTLDAADKQATLFKVATVILLKYVVVVKPEGGS